MIYTAIYKLKINKEKEKLYNLWGKELIALQNRYIKTISRMLGRWYKQVLDDLSKNQEVKYNDLFIDQKQFITKEISNKDFEEYSSMLKDAFNVWAKQLNKAFKKDIKIDTTFNVDPSDALKYANEFAWKRIRWVDEYTQKRINGLISQGIESGWWYNKLADALQRDYSFSDYRARLIASQEIWEAYLNWKDRQFARYTSEYGQKWWKKWISHRDDRTTDGCLSNDNQGWIPYDQEFQSWHMKPTRFVWCRCNCVYRLFDPREDVDGWDQLTIENARPVDETQSTVPEFKTFDEGIKPENYEKLSTKVVPASYYNAIWKKITYVKTKQRAFWQNLWKQLNIWKQATIFETQFTETHELWHAFFDNVVLNNEDNLLKFKTMFTASVEEMLDVYRKNPDIKEIMRLKKLWYATYWQKIFEKIPKLSKVAWYEIKEEIVTYTVKSWGQKVTRETLALKASPKLSEHIGAFYDLIWAMTKEQIWHGHGARYYRGSKTTFFIDLKWGKSDRISEMQVHEFFAHLNETYFMDNDIIKEILPETYKSMKNFYKSIWFDDFI